MLRLKPAMRGADAPGSSAICGGVGLRVLLCLFALAFGLLLLAPASGRANPITDETTAGTTGWEVSQAHTPDIDGYTDKTSVAPGETIGFRVSTKPIQQHQLSDRHLQARLVQQRRRSPPDRPAAARLQRNGEHDRRSDAHPTPSPNAQTGRSMPATMTPTAGHSRPPGPFRSTATTGEYVAEYVLDQSGAQSGIRPATPPSSSDPTRRRRQPSKILVVVPFNTYNAYNVWGGTSAYDNHHQQRGPISRRPPMTTPPRSPSTDPSRAAESGASGTCRLAPLPRARGL